MNAPRELQDHVSTTGGLQEELCALVARFAEMSGSYLAKKERIEEVIELIQNQAPSFDALVFLMRQTDVADTLPIGFPNNEVDEILINHSTDLDQMISFFQRNELRNRSPKTFGFIWSRILELEPRRLPDLVAAIPDGAQRMVSVPGVKQINLMVTPQTAAVWHEIIVEILGDSKRADAVRYAAIHSCLINCPHFSDAWEALKARIRKLMEAKRH